MEKRDSLLLLALAGAGAYGVFTHWDTIREKLGVEDFYPGRLKAIQLAKNAYNWAPPTPNWIVLRDREKNGDITLAKDAWHATEIKDPKFRVTCTWTESGERHMHVFAVDIGFSSVVYEGEAEIQPAAPASPR